MLVLPRILVALALLPVLSPEAQAQFRSEENMGRISTGAPEFRHAVSGTHLYTLLVRNQSGSLVMDLRASHDGGRSWEGPVTLRDGGYPSIDADQHVVAVAHQDSRTFSGGTDVFFCSVSIDGGATFRTTALHTAAARYTGDAIAVRVRDPFVFACWDERASTATDWTRYLQVSGDRGVTWLPAPIQLPAPAIDDERFVVRGSREIHALYLGVHARSWPPSTVQWRGSFDGGRTFQSPLRLDRLSTRSHRIRAARLQDTGTQLVASWIEDYPDGLGPSEAWIATSADGRSWSAARRLNDDHAIYSFQVHGLSVAGSGSRLLAAYVLNYDPAGTVHNDLFVRHSPDGGLTWSSPRRLNPVPGAPIRLNTAEPRCSIGGMRGVVSWLDWGGLTNPGGSAADILYATTADGGATFTAPRSVSTASSSGAYPLVSQFSDRNHDLGFDSEGGVLAWWRDRRSTAVGSDLFVRTMHLPELAVSGTVAPGQAFTITYRHADPDDEGYPFLLLLGASGPAADGPGISLGGDRWIGLRFDAWTSLSLQAAGALSLIPVSGGRATTPPIVVPAGIQLPPLWAAGLVLRPGGPVVGTVTDTLRLR